MRSHCGDVSSLFVEAIAGIDNKKLLKHRAKSINTARRANANVIILLRAKTMHSAMAMNRQILELFVAFTCAPVPCARPGDGDDLSEFVWQTVGASKKFKLFANYFGRAARVIVFGDKFLWQRKASIHSSNVWLMMIHLIGPKRQVHQWIMRMK